MSKRPRTHAIGRKWHRIEIFGSGWVSQNLFKTKIYRDQCHSVLVMPSQNCCVSSVLKAVFPFSELFFTNGETFIMLRCKISEQSAPVDLRYHTNCGYYRNFPSRQKCHSVQEALWVCLCNYRMVMHKQRRNRHILNLAHIFHTTFCQI
jgi:hypothetical protein